METPASTTNTAVGGMSKLTIGIIVVIVLILIGVVYFIYSKSATMPAVTAGGEGATQPPATGPKGNDYVSGATLNKVALSNHSKYSKTSDNLPIKADKTRDDSTPAKKALWDKYNAFWGAIAIKLLGQAPGVEDGSTGEAEPYVRGFLKGLNLELTSANVIAFKNEIKEYLANENKLPHWEVEIGQFLK